MSGSCVLLIGGINQELVHFSFFDKPILLFVLNINY